MTTGGMPWSHPPWQQCPPCERPHAEDFTQAVIVRPEETLFLEVKHPLTPALVLAINESMADLERTRGIKVVLLDSEHLGIDRKSVPIPAVPEA